MRGGDAALPVHVSLAGRKTIRLVGGAADAVRLGGARKLGPLATHLRLIEPRPPAPPCRPTRLLELPDLLPWRAVPALLDLPGRLGRRLQQADGLGGR